MNRIAVPWRVADLAQQIEHLGLDRDVERRGRLVGDQQLGAERQAHRDHRPLLHAARELVRVLPRPLLGRAQMYAPEQVDRLGLRRLPRRLPVQDVRLAHLLVDAQHRVERAQSVLRDQSDAIAAQRPPLGLGQTQDRLARQANVARSRAHAARREAEHGERGHGLAAAGFADQAHDLARPDLEADPLGDPPYAAPPGILQGQRLDLEGRRAAGQRMRPHAAARLSP